MHRSYAMAGQQGADAAKLDRLKRVRTSFGILCGICFIAMCASFLINMRLNG
jgi:CHASE3 domain sensor protein